MNVTRLQKAIDHLRSGRASLRFILRSLSARPPLVRVNALNALVGHARRDAMLLDEFRMAATSTRNQLRLMGTISVAHVAVGCLLRAGDNEAAGIARGLIEAWPEPDRTDLLWYLKSEGLSHHEAFTPEPAMGTSTPRRRNHRRRDSGMIGGTDVIPAVGDPAALSACVRIIRRRWPRARFEDAITGEKFAHWEEIPLARVREILAYPDAEAEAAWDEDRPDSPPNPMLHLIASPRDITAVHDDPTSQDMRSILDSIREMLWNDVLREYAEAA